MELAAWELRNLLKPPKVTPEGFTQQIFDLEQTASVFVRWFSFPSVTTMLFLASTNQRNCENKSTKCIERNTYVRTWDKYLWQVWKLCYALHEYPYVEMPFQMPASVLLACMSNVCTLLMTASLVGHSERVKGLQVFTIDALLIRMQQFVILIMFLTFV